MARFSKTRSQRARFMRGEFSWTFRRNARNAAQLRYELARLQAARVDLITEKRDRGFPVEGVDDYYDYKSKPRKKGGIRI